MLHIASDCNPLPKSTSEGTDREKTYEIICGNNIRVGAERFHSHRTREKVLQNIMKCDDGTRNELHDSVMLSNGTDALKGISERMTKDQHAV